MEWWNGGVVEWVAGYWLLVKALTLLASALASASAFLQKIRNRKSETVNRKWVF